MAGYIAFTGKSRIGNKSDILGIVTDNSDNPKTGKMLQLWIIQSGIDPFTAIKSGNDTAICGKCPHRTNELGQRSCYVNPMGPNSVWRALLRGNYNPINEFLGGLAIRLGAYGDPCALPLAFIKSVCAKVKTHTGYTHQWKNNKAYAPYVMASVDSPAEYYEATTAGWRTFRVKKPSDPLLPNEIMCPNTTHGVQCIKCGLCSGNTTSAKNIAIDVHGRGVKYFDV